MELSRIPEEWTKEIRSHASEATTYLSLHRTDLSLTRTHLSNERTHLSYLRTALALLSFGITLNRFSIFLRQSKFFTIRKNVLFETEYTGLGMVILGTAIIGWALVRYLRVEKEILSGGHRSPLRSIKFMTITILLIGFLSTIWMFVNRH